MNATLRNMISAKGPKFNQSVTGGLSRPYMDKISDYLDEVIKSAMTTLSDDIPLVYKGYRKLTPIEDFYNNINAAMTKNIVDISRSNLFKIEFGFEYDGIAINKVLALPYVERGGYLKLSDASYAMVPVLSEYPIAPAPGEIFVRLLRDKLNIRRMQRNILVDGEKVSVQILHSKTYKLLEKINDKIPIAIYMFVKHGFYGVFEKYFKTKPILVTDPALSVAHLTSEYTVYSTTGMKPRVLKVISYIPHTIRILVKKKDVTPHLESVIASLIYSFDMSPAYASGIKQVAGIKTKEDTMFSFDDIDKESLYWITLLGKLVFKNKYTISRTQIDMLEHIDILNGYLDNIVKEKLREIDIDIEDFYELLAYITEHFNDLLMRYEKHSSELNNRYIDLPYYALFDLIVGVNKAFLEFKRTASRKRLSEKEINKLLNKYIGTKKIFGLIKSTGVNLAIAPIDYTGDNMYFKQTSILESQSRGKGVVRSKNNNFPHNTRTLRAQDLVFGSMLFLGKKAPSPRFRLNPFTNIDIESGKIIITDAQLVTINKLRDMLEEKTSNTEIDVVEEEIDVN